MSARLPEDLKNWASSLRFSGLTVLLVALVAVGVLIVSPSLSTFVQQQRDIGKLRESVRVHRERVAEVDAERVKWQDPVYVRAQARGRLLYVSPGETQLSVIDDVVIPPESEERTSAELTPLERRWAEELVASVLLAGTAVIAPVEPVGEAPGDTPPAPPTENPASPTDGGGA